MSRKDDTEDEELGSLPVRDRTLGWVLTIGGILGFISALDLSIERIAMLKDSGYTPSCSINPVLSCGSVMETEQAAAFGFPNPFIGVASFPIVVMFGLLLLSRVKLPKWMWIGFQVGTVFGFGMVCWLIYQSLYTIGALCPYCMVVWAVMIPIFWMTTIYNITRGNFRKGEPGDFSSSVLHLHVIGMLLLYVVLLLLILFRFLDYWKTLF